MLDHVVEAIRRAERPSVNEVDGSRATITCLRLLESAARDGEPCVVDWQIDETVPSAEAPGRVPV
jgi:hypothetical protein